MIKDESVSIRRKKGGYFERIKGMPKPLTMQIKRRVKFSEVDAMGIVWYGRYAGFFEEGAAALAKQCGLSYKDFYKAELRAPIVQFHIDYYQPLLLDEEFTIRVSFIWNEASRLETEFVLLKQDSSVAATGYTVQMFTDSNTGNTCLVAPELLERCRRRWKAGEFLCQE